MRGLALAVALLSLAPATLAGAQDEEPAADRPPPPVTGRPTSGEASLLSGRTLGVGETLVGAAAGWPGLWAQVQHAPTSTFDLGLRASLTYGALMSLHAGVGGELSLPVRIHLLGAGSVDLAIGLRPAFTLSEGAAVGESTGLYSGDLGWSSRLELGGRLGLHVARRLTLLAGLGGHVGLVHVPAAGDPTVIGAALATFGVEGLISRDTMLFAVAEGGVGFAADRGPGAPVFDPGLLSAVLRLSLGLAYLL